MTFDNGLKFTDDEVTSDLTDLAREYIREYTGTFDYLVQLKGQTKPFSIGQYRGILNCMLAEIKRNQSKPEVAPVANISRIIEYFSTAAANLKYPKVRLIADGVEFVLKLKGEHSNHPGAVDVVSKELVWNDKFGDYAPKWYGRINVDGTVDAGNGFEQFEAVIRQFADDPAGAAQAYGKLTGNCCFCGKQLTDERSTEVGYGPICAGNYELEWGAVAA